MIEKRKKLFFPENVALKSFTKQSKPPENIEKLNISKNQKIDKKIKLSVSSIKNIICSEAVRVHTFGQHFVLTLTICVPGEITVKEGDQIADQLESKLHKNLPNLLAVHIHYHPSKPNQTCLKK